MSSRSRHDPSEVYGDGSCVEVKRRWEARRGEEGRGERRRRREGGTDGSRDRREDKGRKARSVVSSNRTEVEKGGRNSREKGAKKRGRNRVLERRGEEQGREREDPKSRGKRPATCRDSTERERAHTVKISNL